LSATRRPAAFIDRDGTIVHDEGYMARPSQLRLIRNAANGLGRLAAMGYALVVVTNQSGVGRGLITPRQMAAMTRRLRAMLAARGVRLDGVYVCPHHPDDGCGCRKPKPGLLRRAAREMRLDLRRSVMIGDGARDVDAGRAAGAVAIQVTTGTKERTRADYLAKDLLDAARWVTRLRQGRG